ncbi:hypothetical protein [Streptomyces sp. KR80]|uniref:hypothetical protein n=1 Tax=Streptomyces sp. KR80 TaxID=3457426 RepID=UPI003FD3F03F
MTRDQARHVERLLQLCGKPGVAAAVDPADPDGEWRIYDRVEEPRRDITDASRKALYAGAQSFPSPSSSGAVRGFIVPGS